MNCINWKLRYAAKHCEYLADVSSVSPFSSEQKKKDTFGDNWTMLNYVQLSFINWGSSLPFSSPSHFIQSLASWKWTLWCRCFVYTRARVTFHCPTFCALSDIFIKTYFPCIYSSWPVPSCLLENAGGCLRTGTSGSEQSWEIPLTSQRMRRMRA